MFPSSIHSRLFLPVVNSRERREIPSQPSQRRGLMSTRMFGFEGNWPGSSLRRGCVRAGTEVHVK